MINKTVPLATIQFEKVGVSKELLESIRTRGIAIPVRVEVVENGYRCMDGKKRLSACAVLGKEDPKFLNIPVMLLNDFSKAGSAYWGNTQNQH